MCDTVGHFFLCDLSSFKDTTHSFWQLNIFCFSQLLSIIGSISLYLGSLLGLQTPLGWFNQADIVNNHTLLDNLQAQNSNVDFPPKIWTYASNCLLDIIPHSETNLIYARHNCLWKIFSFSSERRIFINNIKHIFKLSFIHYSRSSRKPRTLCLCVFLTSKSWAIRCSLYIC